MKQFLLTLLTLVLAVLSATAQDMTATPLTLEAAEAGAINIVNPNGLTIEYNKNGAGWTPSTDNPISIGVAEGDVVQFRGNNASYTTYEMGELPTRFTATNNVYLYGNLMSLVDADGFATANALTDETGMGGNFSFLFSTPEVEGELFPKENTTIRNHPTKDILLPATTLTPMCYMYLFSGCTGLTRAPELPATTLTMGCYHRIFDNCTGLTTAPTLPAKRLADDCYSCMFAGCTSLNYVKCLATDISAMGALDWWMEGVPAGGTFVKASTCEWPTGLSGIPEGWTVENATADDGDMGLTPLTMEAIADGTFTIVNPLKRTIRYRKNGGEWTSVSTNPITIEVVAGDVVQYKATYNFYCNEGSDPTHFNSSADCYVYGNVMSLINENTFATNRELTSPFALAWLFANDDFSPNTTLKSHPYNELVLPATTLTTMCYAGMFNGCQGLTTAPALPATKLAQLCYDDMFSGCSGLTEAPQLPATKLAQGCYTMMFYGCTGLTKAPDLLCRNVPANAYDCMFMECSNLSYVKCLATTLGLAATMSWLEGVAPTGTFVKMSQMNGFSRDADGIPAGWTLQAATEAEGDYGAIPLTLEAVTAGTITISNPKGLPVHYEYRHDNRYYYLNNNAETEKTFDMEPGDKLIFKGNNASYGCPAPGYGYQISSTADVYVYGNVMSLTNGGNYATATTLTGQENFACLFGNDDPAHANTTIKSHPTKDLVLGATTLTKSCYAMMFAGCQGLTRAPELPAKELAPICYHRMFGMCTGLTKAPELPAETLATECYFAMFDGCSNLSYVKCLATEMGEHNTDDWLNGVAAKGTFVKADGVEWPTGTDGIPEGWTVVEASDSGLKGDVNNDGQVGIGDIVAITNFMAGLAGDGSPVANADVNGDGEVGIGDIVAITNIMAGQQ